MLPAVLLTTHPLVHMSPRQLVHLRFQEGMKAQEALAKEKSGRGPDR